ncbi:MAG: hypothetical protein H6739_16530 [Alphaproteobacteria bacterium]|nr:hypothetical protein [Alphaproteobacteria bacterium]
MTPSRSLSLALVATGIGFALACSGGDTTTTSPEPNEPAEPTEPAEAPSDAPPPSTTNIAFAKWSVPGDVSKRLQAAGWEVGDCEADEAGDLQCYAAKPDRVARVYWFDYEGRLTAWSAWKAELEIGEAGERDASVVLSTRVADQAGSMATIKRLMAAKTDLSAMDDAAQEKILTGDGWADVACEELGESQRMCWGSKADAGLQFILVREADPDNDEWSFDADTEEGGAFLNDTSGWAHMALFPKAEGEALMKSLLTE